MSAMRRSAERQILAEHNRLTKPKKQGRPPAAFKVTATDDQGTTKTKSTNDANEAAAWLTYWYGMGHDVELYNRENDITLRAV